MVMLNKTEGPVRETKAQILNYALNSLDRNLLNLEQCVKSFEVVCLEKVKEVPESPVCSVESMWNELPSLLDGYSKRLAEVTEKLQGMFI